MTAGDAPPSCSAAEKGPISREIAVWVHFIGGPWHDKRGKYVNIDGRRHMRCPGGLYRYDGDHPHGGAVYVFAPG